MDHVRSVPFAEAVELVANEKFLPVVKPPHPDCTCVVPLKPRPSCQGPPPSWISALFQFITDFSSPFFPRTALQQQTSPIKWRPPTKFPSHAGGNITVEF